MIKKFINKYLTQRNIEIGTYLFFGVCAMAVNIGLFSLLLYAGVDYRIANLFALVFTKLFAFVTNKLFVFKSRSSGFKQLITEFVKFFTGRIFTGLIDYFGLILLVEAFSFPERGSKFILQIIVIILNYFFAKLSFYKNKKI